MNRVRCNRGMRLNPTLEKISQLILVRQNFAIYFCVIENHEFQPLLGEETIENCCDGGLREEKNFSEL